MQERPLPALVRGFHKQFAPFSDAVFDRTVDRHGEIKAASLESHQL